MTSFKAAVPLLCLTVAPLVAASGYVVTDRFHVPGNGGFDYLTIDSAARFMVRLTNS